MSRGGWGWGGFLKIIIVIFCLLVIWIDTWPILWYESWSLFANFFFSLSPIYSFYCTYRYWEMHEKYWQKQKQMSKSNNILGKCQDYPKNLLVSWSWELCSFLPGFWVEVACDTGIKLQYIVNSQYGLYFIIFLWN